MITKTNANRENRMYLRINIIVLAVITLFIAISTNSVIAFADINKISVKELSEENLTPVKSVATKIISDDYFLNDSGGMDILTHVINFEAKILEGEYKGKTIHVRQSFDEMTQLSSFPVEVGDKIFVLLSVSTDNLLIGYAHDYVRDTPLILLTISFCLLLIIIGGIKGIKTIISLAITGAALFMFFIPSILNGHSPQLMVIATSMIIVIVTLSLVIGFNRKSLSAGIGCIGGLLASGLITIFMQNVMKISGIVDEDSALLMISSPDVFIDIKGIVFAGIIIGALGATMDVGISIASSLEEIISKAPSISYKEIIKSGFNIGRDILGTMSNTLILAYVGSSLTVLMLMFTNGYTAQQMINLEFVATEILQSLAGSIGLIFTVPITAVVTAVLYRKSKSNVVAIDDTEIL